MLLFTGGRRCERSLWKASGGSTHLKKTQNKKKKTDTNFPFRVHSPHFRRRVEISEEDLQEIKT